jgi:hypothetical protein
MIRYAGREIPCAAARGMMDERCDRLSEFRADASHAFLHVCGEHAKKFRGDPKWVVTPLAPPGTLDELNFTSLDNEALRRMPWIKEITP